METSKRSFNSFELYPVEAVPSNIKERQYVFYILVSINVLLNYDSGVIPASLMQIQEEIPMSFIQKASLGSLVYLGLSLASLIVSPMFQKHSASKTLIVMLFLNCAFCLLFSFSYNLQVMCLSRLGMGFTQAFSIIYAPVWINEFSPKQNETRWMGILQSSVPIGVVCGYTTASLINLTNLVSWRFAIQVQALVELPLIVFFAHINKEDIDIIDHSSDTFQIMDCKNQLKMLFTNAIYLLLISSLCCMFFVIAGVQYWITLVMVAVLRISIQAVMAIFICVSITAPIAGVYTGGYIGDFMGGYKGSSMVPALKFCVISAGLASLCTFPVSMSSTGFSVFVSLWLLLFFGGCIVPCATGIIINSVPREYQPNCSSFAQLCYNILGFFLAPVLSAVIMEQFEDYSVGLVWGFRFVLAFSWIGFLLILVAYIISKHTYKNLGIQGQ